MNIQEIEQISNRLERLETLARDNDHLDLAKIISHLRSHFNLKYIFNDCTELDISYPSILHDDNEVYNDEIVKLISEIAKALLFEDMLCYNFLAFIEQQIETKKNGIAILAYQIQPDKENEKRKAWSTALNYSNLFNSILFRILKELKDQPNCITEAYRTIHNFNKTNIQKESYEYSNKDILIEGLQELIDAYSKGWELADIIQTLIESLENNDNRIALLEYYLCRK